MGDTKEYIANYTKEKTGQVLLRFQKNDKIYIALKKAAADNGVKETHYAKNAILNQLKEDGYIHPLAEITISGPGRKVSHPKK